MCRWQAPAPNFDRQSPFLWSKGMVGLAYYRGAVEHSPTLIEGTRSELGARNDPIIDALAPRTPTTTESPNMSEFLH